MGDPNLPPDYLEETDPLIGEKLDEFLRILDGENEEEDFTGSSDELGYAPNR
jgi:hypothetical protein